MTNMRKNWTKLCLKFGVVAATLYGLLFGASIMRGTVLAIAAAARNARKVSGQDLVNS